MTNKPPLSPSLSMKPSVGPKRPQAQPPQQTRVEAEKLDPSVFFGKRKSPEQELLENAEPIVPQQTPPAPPKVEEPTPEPVQEEKEEEKSAYDAIPESLLDRLVKQYGIDTVKIHKVELEATGIARKMYVGFRALTWDDHTWAVAALAEKLKTEDQHLMTSELQRSKVYQALVACRCVVSIDDTWVWELFNATDFIKKKNPNWTGDTQIGIPTNIINALAINTFELFRNKFHYDFLYELDVAVRSKSEEGGEEEGPTTAT